MDTIRDTVPASPANFHSGSAVLPTKVVRRARITARLSRALRTPLTVLAAPAGFGKTTALQIWLEDSPLPHAWLLIEENHDGVESFIRALIAAVQVLYPEFGRTTLATLAGTAAPPTSMLAVSLISELEDVADDFVLVLDDYHVIRNSGVHDLMRRVVTHLPDGLHLVVASRSAPPWPLARLRALDIVNDIGASYLVFTPPEATALMDLTAGRALSPQFSAAAWARADGWALGLRLIGVALRDRPEATDVISPLHGDSNRDLIQYFLDEVLTRQPASVQSGLLASSILDRFTPELYSAVAGDRGAPDWQEQADLFLIALDEPGWYRRHPMFREALHHELQQRDGPEQVVRLHSRASEWFASQGMINEAIRHALAATQISDAIQLIERHAATMILTDRWPELEAWLDFLPHGAVDDNSWLLTCRAWVLWQRQDFVSMPRLLCEAEALMPDLDTAFGDVPATTVQAAVHTIWAALHLSAGDPATALDRTRQAREVIGETVHPLSGWVTSFEGIALHSAGEHERALTVLTLALEESADQGKSLAIVWALVGLMIVHYRSGRLSDTEIAATRLLELHEAAGRVVGASLAHYCLGMVYYEWNQRDLAREHLEWVINRRHLASPQFVRDSILAMAMLEHIDGRTEAMADLLAGLKSLALSKEDYQTLRQLDEFRALLALSRGDSVEAEWHLALAPASLQQSILAFLPAPQLVRARILLARGETEAAEQTLTAMKEFQHAAVACGHHRQLVEGMALQALAHDRLGQFAEAHEDLLRALLLAQPSGFIRTFVDLGPDTARLLGEGAQGGVAADYIGRLLGAFAASPAHRSAAVEAKARLEQAQALLIEPLTERELAVVRLLGRRLSYAEIAAELTVAQSTVKTHVNHIYGKFGVSGRKEAILTADRLGLIGADAM